MGVRKKDLRQELKLRLPEFRFRMEIFDSWLKESLAQCDSWLDIGCGRNDLLAEFPGKYLQVGMDSILHPELVAETNLHAVRGEANFLPFRKGVLDIITMRQVVEHLSIPSACFREVQRVLRPGGRLLFVTPNKRAPLIWLARRIPQAFKRRLIRRLYHLTEEDIYPTFHRWNQTWQIAKPPTGFILARLKTAENLLSSSEWLLRLSVLWIKVAPLLGLESLFMNIVAEYQTLHSYSIDMKGKE